MKKVKIKYNKNELKIILIALNEFRNNIIKQGRYTEPIDEVIIKINKYI